MNAPFPLDARALRLQFERRAAAFAKHDALLREIESRMVERLDLMRVGAARVIDLGCGPGRSLAALSRRFPRAAIVGLDLAHAPLRRARGELGALAAVRRLLASIRPSSAASALVQGDFAAPPFRAGAFDVAFSNAALHFHPEPHRVLPAWGELLRPGGLLIFSAFGPDTLVELRERWPAPLGHSFIPFADMHDLGDMLVESGFTAPVIEMERVVLSYPDPAPLLDELHALGGNPRADRPRGLASRAHRQRLEQALETLRGADGRLALDIEIVTAHAWKGEPRQRSEPLDSGGRTTRVPLSSLPRVPRQR